MAAGSTRGVPELRDDISCYHSHNLQQYASPYTGIGFQGEGIMCAGWMGAEWMGAEGCDDLLRDPLIRLIMDSDGVTMEAMIGVMQKLRQALASRDRRAPDCRIATLLAMTGDALATTAHPAACTNTHTLSNRTDHRN
jgi:hypothetical protein